MTNPSPNHVVKSVTPGTGAATLVEVAQADLATYIAGRRAAGIPDSNIFVFTPASLEITTVTSFVVNGQPL